MFRISANLLHEIFCVILYKIYSVRNYEHVFAKNWNAMKGYHYLMRLAHLFNTLARFSSELAGLFKQYGVQEAIRFIRGTLTGPWLDPQEIERQLNKPFRLRLV